MTAARLWGLGVVLLWALVAWIYWPTASNGFVWDDWTVVVASTQRGFDAAGLRWAATAFVSGHYQPLTWLSLALDDRVGGGAPWIYHLTNALWHALNTLLVALVSWRLLGFIPALASEAAARTRVLASLLSAALFAVHPLRVESVAWATERRDVLSACLLLLTVWAYLRRFDAGPRAARIWMALALCAHVAALLAKAQMMLPAVLLVLDVHPLRRHLGPDGRGSWPRWRVLLVEKLGFALPSLAIGLVALRAQDASGALTSNAEHGLLARLAQAAYGLVFYVQATCCRVQFSPLHERPFPFDWREPRFLVALVLASVGLGVLVAWRRRGPTLTAAGAIYVLLLLPVLGLSQSGVQLVAERYSYLACLALTLPLAAAWGSTWRHAHAAPVRALLAVVPVAVVAAWAGQAHAQTRVWHDDETLWRHVLALEPSALADNNLGQILAARGEEAAALDHLERSLRTVASYGRPWTALLAILQHGTVPLAPERAARLAAALEVAAAQHPESTVVARTLALAFARAGDDARARRWAAEAERRQAANQAVTGILTAR
jgi:protein O-mannosyl-transferase